MPIAIIIFSLLCRLSPHEVGGEYDINSLCIADFFTYGAFFRCFERFFVELCSNPINLSLNLA
jgi:hypothetical protein